MKSYSAAKLADLAREYLEPIDDHTAAHHINKFVAFIVNRRQSENHKVTVTFLGGPRHGEQMPVFSEREDVQCCRGGIRIFYRRRKLDIPGYDPALFMIQTSLSNEASEKLIRAHLAQNSLTP